MKMYKSPYNKDSSGVSKDYDVSSVDERKRFYWPTKMKFGKRVDEDDTTGDKGSHHTVDSLITVLKTKNHEAILQILKHHQLGEIIEGNRTILHAILNSTVNGNSLITHLLEESVTATREDENDSNYSIQVDFTPLICDLGDDKDYKQSNILRDMLDIKQETARELIQHPVISSFLLTKWRKIESFVLVNFIVYCIFLFTYSIFLGNIFYRETVRRVQLSDLIFGDDNKVIFPSDLVQMSQTFDDDYEYESNNLTESTFSGCYSNFKFNKLVCSLEAILVVTLFLLFLQEVIQSRTLGLRQYAREYENFVELIVILLASLCLIFQANMEVLKWISAFGICFAYLELIFFLGRFPMLGGSLSLMFYSITRHLFKSLINFLILIAGFAFGFFIINHNKKIDYFENPFKAFVKTLVMVLGEFELDEIYNTHRHDPFTQAFTTVLLIGLALMGSLVMVNLFIAIIVSDISQLKQRGQTQDMFNRVQHIIHVESILETACCAFPTLRKLISVPSTIRICAHDLCHCDSLKMPKDLVEGLKRIVRKRKVLEKVKAITVDGLSKNVSATKETLVQSISNVYGKPNRHLIGNRMADVTNNVLLDLTETLLDKIL